MVASGYEQYAWCGTVPWRYRSVGHGPRGLLVLNDGTAFDDLSRRVAASFEPTRHVVVPTYPKVEHVLELTDALVKMLDREGLEQVDVFGHSFGAAVAHVLARRHRDRVRRLALSSFGLYSRLNALMVRGLAAVATPLPRFALRGAGPAQLQLLADLFQHRADYGVDEPLAMPGRVLLALPALDRAFTRPEQLALCRAYPGAVVTRATGPQLDRKLEFFFRLEPLLRALPAPGSSLAHAP